jgi:hypothetical protein
LPSRCRASFKNVRSVPDPPKAGWSLPSVSTIGIVCAREPHAWYWHGTDRRTSDPDVADAVDHIGPCVFESRTHPYHPVPCAPFATESHFDAKRPQKGLRPTQPSGEPRGFFAAL